MGRKSKTGQRTHEPLRAGFIDRLLGLPRLVRLIIALIPALAVVLVFQPIIDLIYLRYFYSEDTLGAPALVIAALAVVMYFAGWMFIVGFPSDEPPDARDRRAALWYLILSGVVIALGLAYIAFNTLSTLGPE